MIADNYDGNDLNDKETESTNFAPLHFTICATKWSGCHLWVFNIYWTIIEWNGEYHTWKKKKRYHTIFSTNISGQIGQLYAWSYQWWRTKVLLKYQSRQHYSILLKALKAKEASDIRVCHPNPLQFLCVQNNLNEEIPPAQSFLSFAFLSFVFLSFCLSVFLSYNIWPGQPTHPTQQWAPERRNWPSHRPQMSNVQFS